MNIFGYITAKYALTKGDDNFTTIDNRLKFDTVFCAAILLCDDTVLRNVNKTARSWVELK